MKKLSILLGVMLISVMGIAQDIPAAILKLHKAGEKVECSFQEAEVMPKLKKETKKAGKLVFEAPETLKMTYTDPEGDYKHIGPNEFTICQAGKVQKLPIKNAESRIAILRKTLLLAMAGKVQEVADLNKAAIACVEKGGQYICTLTNQAKAGVNLLELIYDKKSGALISLRLQEANGNYTVYSTK